MVSGVVRVFTSLPLGMKVLAVLAAAVVLPILVLVLALLSPLLRVLAVLALALAVVMLLVRRRRGAPRGPWGAVALSSLVLFLVFTGVSNALYGGQERAASSGSANNEAKVAPVEETTALPERTEATPEQADEDGDEEDDDDSVRRPDPGSGAKDDKAPPEGSKSEGSGSDDPEDDSEDDDRGSFDTTATVTEVVDGDTINISPAVNGNDEVRLIGMDTPETKDPSEGIEPYGPEASAYAVSKLSGVDVGLEFDQERTDQYGRLLAYVYVGEEMFNVDLVEEGYAQAYPYPPNTRYEERFATAQDEAREAELGIWGLSEEEQCELADRGNGIGEGTAGCVVEAPPEPDPTPVQSGGDLDCSDFASQLQAQEALDDDPSDPNGLDADGDGTACESSTGGGGDGGSASASSSASASASASTSASASGGGGAASPVGGECPAGAPIKGNESSGIYHMPDGSYYDATDAEECFATEAAAQAAGYRASEL